MSDVSACSYYSLICHSISACAAAWKSLLDISVIVKQQWLCHMQSAAANMSRAFERACIKQITLRSSNVLRK